jgi:hypothetical protein
VTASFADNEIWHVLIASDDMKRMNVEQLDDAFRLSLVDASTMVWKAGMKTWQSLGAVAGIDDEPETVVRWIEPPPPPRPIGRPAPRPPSPRSLAPVPASYHTAVTPVFAAPLVAPVYTPQLHAPDPYVLPKRRVSIPSEVDFRRASGGVHWGRWLIALLLITGGVLGAYRQNLLRDGARRLGIENKYLYNEHRVTAFVTAKAPAPLTNVLTRLALLPGPNALPPPATHTSAPVAPPPTLTPALEPAKPSAAAANEPDVKTVSLDSLPVLGTEPEAPKAAVLAAVAPAPRAQTPVAKAPVAKAPVAKAERPAAAPKAAKPEPVAKAEPKPKPEPKPKAEPPPPANENPLKAAIRLAIAADVAKAKAKK